MRSGYGSSALPTKHSCPNVLFTHSYFLRFDPKELKAMMPYPPLGTIYAAARARERGYAVGLFDSMLAEGEEQLAGEIRRQHPRTVVIYDDDFNYLTKMCLTRMREAAFRMSALARKAGCAVVVHGSDSTDHIAEYLQHGADAVVTGEGEETVAEYLDWQLRGIGERAAIGGSRSRREARCGGRPRGNPAGIWTSYPSPPGTCWT